MPETGSYVLSVSRALGAGAAAGVEAGVSEDSAAAAVRFFDFVEVEGAERVYFVVMRA